MPVTPFHFGPGALVSVASPKYVSFVAFCAVNVLIDVESLRNMLTHQARIHTFFHTYLGASFIPAYVVALVITARWLAQRLPDHVLLRWRTLGVLPVLMGSALGAWSHVLLDSVMHSDITPFAPWSSANPLFQVISTTALHLVCAVTGAIAVTWLLLRTHGSHAR